jgi:hypothetical protein
MKEMLSAHAELRMRQRGIREDIIYCLRDCGKPTYAKGGAVKYSLAKKDLRNAISELRAFLKRLERAEGIIVVEGEGRIQTVYHRT